MPLSYNANTPQGSQSVSSTQAPILTNFQSIDSAFNNNAAGGGGNFAQYSVQNVATSFAAKPTNPLGTLYTIASTNGNPELSWINNVNSVGAGPFTGTRITGGGITAACWCQFDGTAASPITPHESYNMASGASITRTGTGDYVLNFARNFATTNYAVMVTASIGSAGASVQIGNRNANNIEILVRNSAALVNSNDINVVIFGTLV